MLVVVVVEEVVELEVEVDSSKVKEKEPQQLLDRCMLLDCCKQLIDLDEIADCLDNNFVVDCNCCYSSCSCH